MSDDPKSVLDPEWVDVTMCGRIYRWKMPSARSVREWTSAFASIEGEIQEDNSKLFSGCNRLLDFFYANNREMAKDREVLDSAQTVEILRVKKELGDFIAGPLSRMNEGLAELAEEIRASQNSNDKKSQPSN